MIPSDEHTEKRRNINQSIASSVRALTGRLTAPALKHDTQTRTRFPPLADSCVKLPSSSFTSNEESCTRSLVLSRDQAALLREWLRAVARCDRCRADGGVDNLTAVADLVELCFEALSLAAR